MAVGEMSDDEGTEAAQLMALVSQGGGVRGMRTES